MIGEDIAELGLIVRGVVCVGDPMRIVVCLIRIVVSVRRGEHETVLKLLSRPRHHTNPVWSTRKTRARSDAAPAGMSTIRRADFQSRRCYHGEERGYVTGGPRTMKRRDSMPIACARRSASQIDGECGRRSLRAGRAAVPAHGESPLNVREQARNP